MELRLSIFERRIGRTLHWHTLGLGPHEQQVHGPTPMKVQHRLVDALRKRIAKLWPEDLVDFEHVRGRRMEVLDLELALGSGGSRRRFRGKVPVIVEPRTRGAAADGHFEIVFHPLRAGEWFVHESDRDLAAEATAFFRQRWADLDSEELETLRADVRDRLRLVAFEATAKSVREKLDKAEPKPLAFLGGGASEKGEALLTQLGTNQTMRAIDGRLDPGMRRSPHREQLQQLVCGRDKASVLLVGPSGVGKSMLIRQLVHDLLEVDGYVTHRNLDRVHRVWEIRGRRIIAGMSYLGQWEKRCVDLLDACRKKRAVLWVDDIAAWGSIGVSRESERSLATFFSGPVTRGEVTVIGETTPEGWTRLSEDAPALASGFTVLHVEPTSRIETTKILLHVARTLEREQGAVLDPLVFDAIHQLCGAAGAATAYPGRAVDLLRALVSTQQGSTPDLRHVEADVGANRIIFAIKGYRELMGVGLREAKEAVEAFMARGVWPAVSRPAAAPAATAVYSSLAGASSLHRTTPGLGRAQLVGMLSARTGMPPILLTPQQSLSPDDVDEALRRQIMGQEPAVAAMRALILRIKAGLADASRPLGVYLFTGPTGTGKTEMAKCLAEYLYGTAGRLVRLDMSEFSSPDAPSRMIGDRFDPEGVLTSKVRVQPFCVVLLDEIEKAHPSVLHLLLQLFDDGRLTDASGTTVDFSHTVVIMTSNLGARVTPSAGFGETPSEAAAAIDAAIREFFPPELFNRIDRIVPFAPLSSQAAHRIARRELGNLLDRRGLTERNVFVHFTEAVVDLVVQQGFRQHDGARSLKRWLEDHVGAFLADEIAARPGAAIRSFWLYVEDGKLALHAEHLEEAPTSTSHSVLEDVIEWNFGRLRAEVPAALEQAEALQRSDALATLAETLSRRLGAAETGDEAAADAVYNLEQLRSELGSIVETLRTQNEYDPLLVEQAEAEQWAQYEGELREAQDFGVQERVYKSRAGTQVVRARSLDARQMTPTLPLQNRPALLEALGQLHFVAQAVTHATDPTQHTVMIELTRVSRSAAAGRFEGQRPGLLEWLAESYASARGRFEGCAVVDEHRRVHERGRFEARHAWHRVVFRLGGPAVRLFFAGEHGTHVRESLTGGTELVRVRVLRADGVTPVQHLERLDGERAAFVAILQGERAASSLPAEHPDAVLPVIRRYRYDPAQGSEPAPIEVEDLALEFVTETRVRHLREVLRTLWFLRLGTQLSPAAPTEAS